MYATTASTRFNPATSYTQPWNGVVIKRVNNPPLILADEPTGNLDSKSSVEIMDILHKLHKGGATIIMVTHEPDIAEHAERVICVKDGVILSDGRSGNNPCLSKRPL